MVEFRRLGKDNRHKLPACAITVIKEKYPSMKGHYVGFRDNDLATVTKTLQQF